MAKKGGLTIELINQRLKAASVGVSVLQRSERLYLQATLPPKSGDKIQKDKQRQIALGIYANEWGLAEAQNLALKLGSDLARGQFDWVDWQKSDRQKAAGETCGEWVEQYRKFLWQSKFEGNEAVKQTLWRKRYFNVGLKWLPMLDPLTKEALISAALHYSPSTRSRQLACHVLQQFAAWCKVECDLQQYRGNYSVKDVQRHIPSVEAIVEAIDRLVNPQWQWVAAVMAIYGLRDHEVWMSEFIWKNDPVLGRILVANVIDGKTGARNTILPMHPEWVDRWDVSNIRRPKLTVRTNDEYGERTSRQFKRYNMPFRPYDLRHAYGLTGSVENGQPIAVSSAMMGHSPDVHLKIYNKHLTEEQKWEAFRRGQVNRKPTT